MKRRKHLGILGLGTLGSFLGASCAQEDSNKSTKTTPENSSSYNLVIYGATPGGIACAVRAAREGLIVLIVHHTQHLGGMFINGIGTMDTLYNGARAPIYDELRYNIYNHYRTKYGKKSPQYKATNPGFPKTQFESHVIERLINEMLERESRITILRGYFPVSVTKNDSTLEKVTFRQMEGHDTVTLQGDIFADCSYEGDLAAVAGVDYRIGRESREEYGEQHAGVAYSESGKKSWPPSDIIHQEHFKLARRLNLYRYNTWTNLMPGSTGESHNAVQAYNLRTTLTTDANRFKITEEPKDYNPEYLKESFGDVHRKGGLKVGAMISGLPNLKASWNQPELIGEQNKYVEGDWSERKQITEKFRNVTLGVLYFQQNDPSVPKELRKHWKKYGLPLDEYEDNGHMPYEIYVREARRIVGRSVFTQHDGQLAKGLKRAPIHKDSIGITEWFMDSHACTDRRIPGSKQDGEVMLQNRTFPGQLSYNAILPKGLDNLMVPVCLSASHVGWGTIRLEPTWMSFGEAAGYAASLAVNQSVSPAKVDTDKLIRLLADKRIMISFFNDIEGREYAPWYPAVQYLGTQGFFGSYEALPNNRLNKNLAELWINYTAKWIDKKVSDPAEHIREMLVAEEHGDGTVNAEEFVKGLGNVLAPVGYYPDEITRLTAKLGIPSDSPLTRGNACRLIVEATRKR